MKALSVKWVFVITLSFIAFIIMHTAAYGQNKKPAKKHKHTSTQKAAVWPGPQSASRVYFPDYYTFYDPARHGYIYWQEDKWMVSPEKPFFMKDADLGKARVQLLKDEQLALPEDRFDQYMRLYPPQPLSPTVPVPIITISKQKQ